MPVVWMPFEWLQLSLGCRCRRKHKFAGQHCPPAVHAVQADVVRELLQQQDQRRKGAETLAEQRKLSQCNTVMSCMRIAVQ